MWDTRFSEPGFAYGTEPNDFLKAEYARIPQGGKVLCLAEGEGRNGVFLARMGYEVTAVDQSAVGLEKAKELAGRHQVDITTVVADLAGYSLGTSRWDGIVSIAAHVPPPMRKDIHRQVVQSLRPGGIFLLEAYTPRQLEMEGMGGPPPSMKDLLMSLEELKSELAGLDILIGREVDRDIREGRYHRGNSAVVQLIALKR